MTGDVNALRTILLYHFSNGVFINGGLETGVTNLLKTLQGQNLQVLSVRTPRESSLRRPEGDPCVHPEWRPPEPVKQFVSGFHSPDVFITVRHRLTGSVNLPVSIN